MFISFDLGWNMTLMFSWQVSWEASNYNYLQDKAFHVELSKCKISRENVNEWKRNGLILEMFEIAASYFMECRMEKRWENWVGGEHTAAKRSTSNRLLRIKQASASSILQPIMTKRGQRNRARFHNRGKWKGEKERKTLIRRENPRN